MQRAQLGQKHKLNFSPRIATTKKRLRTEQHQYQPLTPLKTSPTPIKQESDTTSDYSLPSVDELKHNTIEQPDHKPPECLLADEQIIKDEPEESHFIKRESKYEEDKYEIEPPSAQPPPRIMDECVSFVVFFLYLLII